MPLPEHTSRHRSPWEPWEDELVIEAGRGDGPAVAKRLGRTPHAVQLRRTKLVAAGICPRRSSRLSEPGSGPYAPYTQNELAMIGNPTLTNAEVAERTGRSASSIRRARHARGIDYRRERVRNDWTEEENARLVELAALSNTDIGARLHRSLDSIKSQRRKLIVQGNIQSKRMGTQ